MREKTDDTNKKIPQVGGNLETLLNDEVDSKATYIKKKPVCYLYYITTGKWVDDQNCTGRMDIARNDLLDMNIFDDVEIQLG